MGSQSGTFGQRLRAFRSAQGLTQQALAEPEYTHAYVSSLEAGRRQPSAEAVRYFAARLEVDDQELVTGRPAALEVSLELRLHDARVDASAGKTTDADAAFVSIAEEAARFDLITLQARAEYGRGACCEHDGRIDRALEFYERAEELLEGQPPVTRTDAVAGKARCLHMLGDLRYAIHLLESHLDALTRAGLADPTSRLVIHATLVLPYLEAGLLKKAEESATDALQLVPDVEDPAKIAMMHVNVARVLLDQKHYKDAAQALRRAADLYRQLDLRVELGIAHLALGYVMKRKGENEPARIELETAIRVFVECRSQVNEARAANELASLLREEGRVDEARGLLSRVIELLTDESDVAELALAHRELAQCDAPSSATDAEKNLRRAVELFERAEQPAQVAATYRVLGDLFRAGGRIEESLDAYRTGILELERHI